MAKSRYDIRSPDWAVFTKYISMMASIGGENPRDLLVEIAAAKMIVYAPTQVVSDADDPSGVRKSRSPNRDKSKKVPNKAAVVKPMSGIVR